MVVVRTAKDEALAAALKSRIQPLTEAVPQPRRRQSSLGHPVVSLVGGRQATPETGVSPRGL